MTRWLISLTWFLSLTCFAHALEKSGEYVTAEKLREEGKTLDALHLFNTALVNYQSQGDYTGVIKSLEGTIICWQHLFNKTKDPIYGILAKNQAQAIFEIAESRNLHHLEYEIHFFNGKSYVLLKDFPKAETEFNKAVELYPADDAQKGDWMAHLGYVIYQNGNKEKGKNTILEGIKQMEQHKEGLDSFQMDVWMSGAYLRMAELLRVDNFAEGRYYLDKAQQIIHNDPHLVIRKEQLQKLEKEYEKG